MTTTTARHGAMGRCGRTRSGAGAGIRLPRPRVGAARRTSRRAHSRPVSEPSVLGAAVRRVARRRLPASRLRPPWPRDVGGADRRGGRMHDSTLWADDLAAVIDGLGLDRPVLVGWSYGSLVIGDYLRTHGQGNVAALDFAAGAVRLGPTAFGSLIGPGFLDHFADLTADDLPTSIRGVRGLVHAFAVTHSQPTTSRQCCAQAWWCPRRPEATWARGTSTTTTYCAACTCPSWSATAGRTPSCYQPWPSMCSMCVQRPRRPGMTRSATCRSWSAQNVSTTSLLH